jgi:hypothetical protein
MTDHSDKWFAMIGLADPTPAHRATFRRYCEFVKAPTSQEKYQNYLEQLGGLEAAATVSDAANIWFHTVLFAVMGYEIEHQIAGGACLAYGYKIQNTHPHRSLGFLKCMDSLAKA